MCSRARRLDGPWETIRVLDDAHGGHQGAIVDLPDGNWYGFVMRDGGPIGHHDQHLPDSLEGRLARVGRAGQPRPRAGDGQEADRGPVRNRAARLDRLRRAAPAARLAVEPQPGQHALVPDRPARQPAPQGDGRAGLLRTRRNSLTHKGWGPTSYTVAPGWTSRTFQPGDAAGLGMLGKSLVTLAVQRSADGQAKLISSTSVEHDGEVAPKTSADIGKAEVIHLALQMDFTRGKGRCGYSPDGKDFTAIGDEFPLMFDWQARGRSRVSSTPFSVTTQSQARATWMWPASTSRG